MRLRSAIIWGFDPHAMNEARLWHQGLSDAQAFVRLADSPTQVGELIRQLAETESATFNGLRLESHHQCCLVVLLSGLGAPELHRDELTRGLARFNSVSPMPLICHVLLISPWLGGLMPRVPGLSFVPWFLHVDSEDRRLDEHDAPLNVLLSVLLLTDAPNAFVGMWYRANSVRLVGSITMAARENLDRIGSSLGLPIARREDRCSANQRLAGDKRRNHPVKSRPVASKVNSIAELAKLVERLRNNDGLCYSAHTDATIHVSCSELVLSFPFASDVCLPDGSVSCTTGKVFDVARPVLAAASHPIDVSCVVV